MESLPGNPLHFPRLNPADNTLHNLPLFTQISGRLNAII